MKGGKWQAEGIALTLNLKPMGTAFDYWLGFEILLTLYRCCYIYRLVITSYNILFSFLATNFNI